METSAYQSLTAFTKYLTTIAGAAILIRSLSDDLIPIPIYTYLSGSLSRLYQRFSSKLTIVVQDYEGFTANLMFEAVNVYLGTKISPSTQQIRVNKPLEDEEFVVTIDKDQEIVDVYSQIKFEWILKKSPNLSSQNGKNGTARTEDRSFILNIAKKHRDFALKVYLPYVLRRAKEILEEKRTVSLHAVDYNGRDYWGSVVMNHPSTFDTLAMDPQVKKELIEDLDRFVKSKDFYRRVGRAWKRGYLFYGPPGTGKSSLIAAMANYLKFDVYDLDLSEVQCNSDLRRLLMGSTNRSIIVIEDIDCNVGLQNRQSGDQTAEEDKITLSGLLNFIDGLWSSCGDERIIMFTTNHKDRLDPALLRPGRMDVQLEMGYCTFDGFKTLAWNYLRVEEHPIFDEVKELLKKVDATPAEVASELIKSDAGIALRGLVQFLEKKQVGDEEAKKTNPGVAPRSLVHCLEKNEERDHDPGY